MVNLSFLHNPTLNIINRVDHTMTTIYKDGHKIVLCKRMTNICYAWKTTSTFHKEIDTSKNIILKATHLPPFSANNGFFSCNHFKIINDILDIPIDWNLWESHHLMKKTKEALDVLSFSIKHFWYWSINDKGGWNDAFVCWDSWHR